jgi:hypothetical protein
MINLTDEERDQMSFNGKQYYRSHFSFSHVKETLVADLKRLSK